MDVLVETGWFNVSFQSQIITSSFYPFFFITLFWMILVPLDNNRCWQTLLIRATTIIVSFPINACIFTTISNKWHGPVQETLSEVVRRLRGPFNKAKLKAKYNILMTEAYVALVWGKVNWILLIETRRTVAGPSAHHCRSLLRTGDAAESLCQASSCTTDCNYLAWFWPGPARHYCVPTHHRVPSACCHQPITQSPVPSGGLTWRPTGFHPAQRNGLCQDIKIQWCAPTAAGSRHQLPNNKQRYAAGASSDWISGFQQGGNTKIPLNIPHTSEDLEKTSYKTSWCHFHPTVKNDITLFNRYDNCSHCRLEQQPSRDFRPSQRTSQLLKLSESLLVHNPREVASCNFTSYSVPMPNSFLSQTRKWDSLWTW